LELTTFVRIKFPIKGVRSPWKRSARLLADRDFPLPLSVATPLSEAEAADAKNRAKGDFCGEGSAEARRCGVENAGMPDGIN
jgi:hypothetical protein